MLTLSITFAKTSLAPIRKKQIQVTGHIFTFLIWSLLQYSTRHMRSIAKPEPICWSVGAESRLF